jgi:hypothetical protein
MSESTALARTEELSPLHLIQNALSNGLSPEVIRELVTLQQSAERFSWEREERQSRIDFDDALNRCQRQIGRVKPNVNRTDTNSWWADYTQLDRTVRPIYTEEGFAICFSEVAPVHTGKVRIKADLSRGGISKEYFREITPSTTGPKGGAMATATDADAIAGSRAKRYLILDIFNISMGIDQEEKAGIVEDKPTLGDEEFVGLRDTIDAAENLPELKKFFEVAYKRAQEIGDKSAMDAFIKAKDARKKAIA